LLVVIGINYP